VYRLITRGTYEQEMFDTASKKLGLDRAILQRQGSGESSSTSGPPSSLSKAEVEKLLKRGAYCVLDDEQRFVSALLNVF
jgi:SNF2 family DNA or RNA helicase